jgi:hypothetical protein
MTVEQPPEMALIERMREAPPKLAVSQAAKQAKIHESRWRQLAKGYQQVTSDTRVPTKAPAETLARMADAVGVSPAQLKEVGRADAAAALQELLRNPPGDGLSEVSPDLTIRDTGEPAIIGAIQLFWDRILAVTTSLPGDPDWPANTDRLIIVAADVLTDVLLGFRTGPSARPLVADLLRHGDAAVARVLERQGSLDEPQHRDTLGALGEFFGAGLLAQDGPTETPDHRSQQSR